MRYSKGLSMRPACRTRSCYRPTGIRRHGAARQGRCGTPRHPLEEGLRTRIGDQMFQHAVPVVQLSGEFFRCSIISWIYSIRLVRILNCTVKTYCSFCSVNSYWASIFSVISRLILLRSHSALLRGAECRGSIRGSRICA